jgi:ATP-binding cassette subfamily F protein 3
MNIAPGDRIGLLGPNGAGKSTLTRLLAGELEPRGGAAVRSPYLKVGYFAQHQLEQLDVAASPLDHLRKLDPRIGERGGREYLAAFHFRGGRVFEPVGPFSGGEKARLALALVVYGKPNLLLLDEPTNHLDLDLRHALEIALQDYAGALVLVSHDRHLLESTCDTLWRVSNGGVHPFDGDLDDYARWLAQREREYDARQDGTDAVPAPALKLNPKEQRRAAAERRALDKALRDAVTRSEAEMARLQARLVELDQDLLAPARQADAAQRGRLVETQKEQKNLRRALAAAEERWLEATAQLESTDAPP